MSTYYSVNEYTGDGSTKQFPINFSLDYISRGDVSCYVDGAPVTFTWLSEGLIDLDSVPASGAYVRISRKTDVTKLINDYQNGSVIIEQNLDDSFSQTVMSVQEIYDSVVDALTVDSADGKVDALNRVIKNLADGVNDQDAATVGQIGPFVSSASASAAAALVSENNAATSETNAATSESNINGKLATIQSNGSSVEDNVSTITSEPIATQLANAASNAAAAASSEASATQSAAESAGEALVSKTYATNSANSAAAAQASLDEFQGQYHGALATAPTVGVDTGDLYFDTTLSEMRVYAGSVWVAAGSTVNGTSKRQSYTATAGQTSFTVTGGYDAGFADVYLNGVKLVNGVDVDVSSGTGFTLTTGATVGDNVDFIGYGAFVVADTYTQAEIDAKDALKANITYVDTQNTALQSTLETYSDNNSIGVNQTWQDVTSSRSFSVTYTNTTGKPIQVNAQITSPNTGSYGGIQVDGVYVDEKQAEGGGVYAYQFSAFVPSGSSYVFVSNGSSTLRRWLELR